MRRKVTSVICSFSLVALILVGSTAANATPSTGPLPAKVALIVMENQTFTDITSTQVGHTGLGNIGSGATQKVLTVTSGSISGADVGLGIQIAAGAQDCSSTLTTTVTKYNSSGPKLTLAVKACASGTGKSWTIQQGGCAAGSRYDPYICDNLVTSSGLDALGGIDIRGTGSTGNATNGWGDGGMYESVSNGDAATCTAPCDPIIDDGSSYEYMYMTSADGCSGDLFSWNVAHPSEHTGDGHFNNGEVPFAAGATHCGSDVFAQMGSAGVGFKVFNEDFASGVNCVATGTNGIGYSDNTGGTANGGSHQEWTRKHDPLAFYQDDTRIADGGTQTNGSSYCEPGSAPTNNVGFPGDTSTGADDAPIDNGSANNNGHPFATLSSLPQFSMIMPDLCHDMHNNDTVGALGDCSVGTGHDAWSSPAPPMGCDGTTPFFDNSSSSCAQVWEGDQWLSYNLPDILDLLGPTGTAIVIWDEDGTPGSTAQQEATFVIPGTGGTLVNTTGVAATSADRYDMGSIAKTIVDTFGLSCNSFSDPPASHAYGKTNCTAANRLPVDLQPALLQTNSGSNGTGTGSSAVSATFPAGTTAGSLLVDVITTSGGATITAAPSGFTLGEASTGNVWIYYKANAASTSSAITATLNQNASWTSTLLEYSGIVGSPVDASNFYYSNTMSVGTLDTNTTSTTSTQPLEVVVGAFTDTGATVGTSCTSGYTKRGDRTAGTNNWTGVFDQVATATGTFRVTCTLSPTSKVRGAILTFKATT